MESFDGKRRLILPRYSKTAIEIPSVSDIQFRTADAQSPVHVLSQANVDLPLGGTLNHCHRLRYGVGTYTAKVYPGEQPATGSSGPSRSTRTTGSQC